MVKKYFGVENGRYVRTRSSLSICRIDCCTFFVELDGYLAVFDPWLHDPARFAPLWSSSHGESLVIQELPKPDVLFITQNAPDHCDLRAISSLPRETIIAGPAGVIKRVKSLGFSGQVLSPGDSQSVGPFHVTVLPAEHPGVLKQNVYLIKREKKGILFLADPAVTPELIKALDQLKERPEILLLSSTAFTLRCFGRIVMNSEEAAEIAMKVGSPHVFLTRTLMDERVGGTIGKMIVKSFDVPLESTQRFINALSKTVPGSEVHLLERGEVWDNG